jgi:hypothetical protein
MKECTAFWNIRSVWQRSTCGFGEKTRKTIVMDILWEVFLGTNSEPGFDVEIFSGIREGVGVDNVAVEAAWAEESLGTPFEKSR